MADSHKIENVVLVHGGFADVPVGGVSTISYDRTGATSALYRIKRYRSRETLPLQSSL